MEVTMPEKKWTDERHDDLNTKVEGGFARADRSLGEFRGEVNARFGKVDERFDAARGEVNARFDKVDERFGRLDKKIDRLAYLLLTVALGYIATHAL
jgi:tetrahydromethanopterin S-methyltransferase subunit G